MSKTFPRAMTILVVEDEPGDFGLIRADVRMAGLGHSGEEPVIWAKTLAEGITLARPNQPDVVLLDLSLPDSSGSATVRAMRVALPDVPIVVLTGHDDNALADAALGAGAQDYLVKGQFDHDALTRAVRHAVVREALESRLRLFEAALNSAADSIVITDNESHIQWANPAFTRMTGFTLEEALNRTPGELFKSGKHDQAFYRNMWETILSGQPWRGELVNRRKNGTLYDEALAIAPVAGSDGTVRHFVAIKQNITERKATEQKVQRLSQLYATLSECNDAIVHCASEETLFPQICRDAVHLGGMKMAWIGLVDAVTHQVKPVASCGDDLNYLEGILISVDADDPYGCGPTGIAIREKRPFWCQDFQHDPATAPWRERGKNSGWYGSAALPLLRNGTPVGTLTIYADTVNAFDEESRQLLIKMAGNISYALDNFDREAERRKAEEKLRELNETLERRVEEELTKNRKKDLLLIQQSRLASMGEMVHNISHHWRQPLTALGLAVQNIQLDYRDNLLNAEELEKYVAAAQTSIQRLTSTIDDFRRFFKASKERQPFLAGDEVEKAINMVSQGFARDNIEITLENRAAPCSAFGHPSEFAQVVLSVLTNAKEAIGGKTTARKIHIMVGNSESATTVAIRNNGGSIPEDILGKVFDPYFSTKESGAGIGLYLSKMIMQNMGGDIAIHNVENGVEVLLTLPLAGEPAPS